MRKNPHFVECELRVLLAISAPNRVFKFGGWATVGMNETASRRH
ncbi:hypothetical protein HMPREF0201_02048 [Cedecea davisae DSM 4568]|uniref:Uncharacterized protein n=1 Tax=Cedecea davisae DSM 4568 TaxID=566551 RepID=S3ISQ5_9ENTR|nr:hypothetical protein HMPREF0201_02048 [Cedecea davisae DSM 4568]